MIDQVCEGRLAPEQAAAALEKIRHMPPASTLRFSVMAGLGAMALGVIFGAAHLLSLALIGLSALLGGLLRRGIGRLGDNALIQPFAAALLAGLVGAIAVHLDVTSLQWLVAVCPCMVLVPGPHLLNGAIDLVRGRIMLGLARLTFATVIGLAISTGLLLGLALGQAGLPVADRLRLPFAGLAFASVVSLIPGVVLFRMAGGLAELVQDRAIRDPGLIGAVLADAATALLILMAMTVGLIVPKMIFEWTRARIAKPA